jgi:hypothetical protein
MATKGQYKIVIQRLTSPPCGLAGAPLAQKNQHELVAQSAMARNIAM